MHMSSFVLIHIIIAVLSVGVSSVVFFKPSIKKLVLSYGLVVATVASGTYLLMLNPSNMLHTCLSGLFYVTVVTIITIATHMRAGKLAKQEM